MAQQQLLLLCRRLLRRLRLPRGGAARRRGVCLHTHRLRPRRAELHAGSNPATFAKRVVSCLLGSAGCSLRDGGVAARVLVEDAELPSL